ncbi:hypothetical protein D478_21713 [Brevibacillus agri BAB-2500]|nr:hypothetical protein D478_21713 [Brevibacillus agri BAB-2500]
MLQPIAVVNEQEEKQGGVRQKNAFPRRLFGKKQGDHRACHHQKMAMQISMRMISKKNRNKMSIVITMYIVT